MDTTHDNVTPINTPKRARQPSLPAPGMTVQTDIPEVEQAAQDYRAIRDERMELTKREKEAKEKLIEIAASHGVKLYEYQDDDGETMQVKQKLSYTVRKKGSTTSDDEGEE